MLKFKNSTYNFCTNPVFIIGYLSFNDCIKTVYIKARYLLFFMLVVLKAQRFTFSANRELILLKEQYEGDMSKLKALLKRFEIKYKSLEVTILQKEEENKQLSALCDEVTGKRL